MQKFNVQSKNRQEVSLVYCTNQAKMLIKNQMEKQSRVHKGSPTPMKRLFIRRWRWPWRQWWGQLLMTLNMILRWLHILRSLVFTGLLSESQWPCSPVHPCCSVMWFVFCNFTMCENKWWCLEVCPYTLSLLLNLRDGTFTTLCSFWCLFVCLCKLWLVQ